MVALVGTGLIQKIAEGGTMTNKSEPYEPYKPKGLPNINKYKGPYEPKGFPKNIRPEPRVKLKDRAGPYNLNPK